MHHILHWIQIAGSNKLKTNYFRSTENQKRFLCISDSCNIWMEKLEYGFVLGLKLTIYSVIENIITFYFIAVEQLLFYQKTWLFKRASIQDTRFFWSHKLIIHVDCWISKIPEKIFYTFYSNKNEGPLLFDQ